MAYRSKLVPTNGDRRAIPVIVLGIFVALLPFLFLPSPGDGGPITFVVRLMQGIALLAGIGVIYSGYYSYRTRNLRPAIAVGSSIIGLVVVGAVGGYVETSGGPLIPIWVWFLAAIVVIGISFWISYQFVGTD